MSPSDQTLYCLYSVCTKESPRANRTDAKRTSTLKANILPWFSLKEKRNLVLDISFCSLVYFSTSWFRGWDLYCWFIGAMLYKMFIYPSGCVLDRWRHICIPCVNMRDCYSWTCSTQTIFITVTVIKFMEEEDCMCVFEVLAVSITGPNTTGNAVLWCQ